MVRAKIIDNAGTDWVYSHGLYLPDYYLSREDLRLSPRPIAVDLFSGAGGMSLGLIQAGFDVIAALEWEPCAIHTYLVNLGAYPVQMIFIEDADRERMEKYMDQDFAKVMKSKKTKPLTKQDIFVCSQLISGSNRHNVCPEFSGVKYMFVGDARKITGERILEVMGLKPGEVDMVCGGPPCQGFSKANSRRNVMDPRNSLVLDFARLVCEIHPRVMFVENVPEIVDMTTPEGIPVMDAFCHILASGSFGDYEALRKSLLSTAGCGAAISRNNNSKKTKPQVKRTKLQAEGNGLGQPGLF